MSECTSLDEPDTVGIVASAPPEEDLESSIEDTCLRISNVQLMESAPSAPVLDEIPRTVPS
jgi:hypothetical protein